MFYVSDHGESLGENGLYLHGLPRFIAPDTQTHVSAIIWFDDGFYGLNMRLLAKKADNKYSHDNVFHTILGFMEIESDTYDRRMNVLRRNLIP
jgi:lipid A ethanolaminephosphotransferase